MVVASNHLSFIDSVVIPIVAPGRSCSSPRRCSEGTGISGSLTRAWFAPTVDPVERRHVRCGAGLPGRRPDDPQGRPGLRIHPEGTRSRDGRLYRGKTAVGWLALTAQVPVVPCAVIGTDKLRRSAPASLG